MNQTPVKNEALHRLIHQLSLEPVTTDVFLGESSDLLGTGRIFGGQVLGQALMAASLTIVPERHVHSMHCYFIRQGNVNIPIRFEVERVRDGGSFSVRRVTAYQEDKHIFTMSSSFQIEEAGFNHQDAMPTVPGPEHFMNEEEIVRKYADRLPRKLSHRFLVQGGSPIEIRAVNPQQFFMPGNYEPSSYMWFRANGQMPDNALLHKAALAYFSDFYLLFTTLLPHHQIPFDPNIQLASLDHTLWFHRPINMNEWNLFCVESPNASSARGLAFAQIFNQQGQLVATTAQEGLTRNSQRFPAPE